LYHAARDVGIRRARPNDAKEPSRTPTLLMVRRSG
jgi:hypothetical protein